MMRSSVGQQDANRQKQNQPGQGFRESPPEYGVMRCFAPCQSNRTQDNERRVKDSDNNLRLRGTRGTRKAIAPASYPLTCRAPCDRNRLAGALDSRFGQAPSHAGVAMLRLHVEPLHFAGHVAAVPDCDAADQLSFGSREQQATAGRTVELRQARHSSEKF